MHVAPLTVFSFFLPRQNFASDQPQEKKTCRFGKSKLPGPRQHPNSELPEPVICCRIDVASKPLQFALPPLQRCIRGASLLPKVPETSPLLSPPFLSTSSQTCRLFPEPPRALRRCATLPAVATARPARPTPRPSRTCALTARPRLSSRASLESRERMLFGTGSQTGASEERRGYNTAKVDANCVNAQFPRPAGH